MRYVNANIFMSDGHFHKGSLTVKNGVFEDVSTEIYDEYELDLDGKYIIPGVIDIHTHGNSGFDFSNGEFIDEIMRYYAKNGVTSATPASMTVAVDNLEYAYKQAKSFADNRPVECARLLGINMEGPFFSYNKRGAQNPDYLLQPSSEVFDRLNKASGNMIKIVCVAPELEGALEFIEYASNICTVSIAHTEASYDLSVSAIVNGATHLTHLFNGMPGLHHRNAGPIGAGAESDNVYAELICDGMHVSPSAIRAAFKLFPGRICIISDSLACCGLPEGEYDSGGMQVFLKNNICTLANGTIAGSVCNAYQGMRNAISYGIDKEEAILAATLNPAKQVHCDDMVGSIETGKKADYIICEEDLSIIDVFIDGNKI